MMPAKHFLVFLFLACPFLADGFASFTGNALSIRESSPKVQSGTILSATAGTDSKTYVNGAAFESSIGKITFLIPSKDSDSIASKFGTPSPYGNPPIREAVEHLAQKSFAWADGKVDTEIITVPTEEIDSMQVRLEETDVLLAIGLQSEADLKFASDVFENRLKREPSLRKRQCQFILDSAKSLPAFVGPYDPISPSLAAGIFPWTEDASARRLYDQMTNLYSRWTTDDFCYATMLFLNQFSGHSVDWVKHTVDATWEKGPIRNAQEIYSMVDKCGDCIVDCLKDEKCKQCITTLTEIDSRDQVTSYRTIVSFESDLLRDFSQCILTRNNIFNCDAKIPTIPKVTPMATFRGAPLTEEVAKSILVGHLDDPTAPEGSLKTDISWKVACGANVAYDQFPSQNQLFYPAAKRRDMWYDPVFRVETLDGRSIWCKRHYKVRPQKVPGTYRFSVLDNGVTSDEFWTIVACADDLSWIVFHYAGAAKAVGLQYLGGLLCTPDGSMPDAGKLPEIWKHLRSAGIQPWELYKVDNREDTLKAIVAGPAPLDFYRGPVLEKRAASNA